MTRGQAEKKKSDLVHIGRFLKKNRRISRPPRLAPYGARSRHRTACDRPGPMPAGRPGGHHPALVPPAPFASSAVPCAAPVQRRSYWNSGWPSSVSRVQTFRRPARSTALKLAIDRAPELASLSARDPIHDARHGSHPTDLLQLGPPPAQRGRTQQHPRPGRLLLPLTRSNAGDTSPNPTQQPAHARKAP